MLDILKFILSDFWVFVGTIILVESLGTAMAIALAPVASLCRFTKVVHKEKKEVA